MWAKLQIQHLHILWPFFLCPRHLWAIGLSLSEYEGCTLNLVHVDVSDQDKYMSVVEALRTSTQGEHISLWTVRNRRGTRWEGRLPFGHLETCSINILLHGYACHSAMTHRNVFFPREYQPNAHIFISMDFPPLTPTPLCFSSKIGKYRANFQSAPYFAFIVSPIRPHHQTMTINRQFIFCYTCPGGWISSGNEDTSSLRELKLGWNALHRQYNRGLIQVKVEHKAVEDPKKKCVYHVSQFLDDCYSSEAMAEIISVKLNLTVHWFPGENWEHFGTFHDDNPRVIGMIATEWGKYIEQDHPGRLFLQISVHEYARHFLYCTKSREREISEFRFWFIPFDLWSWLLLGLATVGNMLIVKSWFLINGVLLKQPMGKSKFLRRVILFNISLIVLTCIYESRIASFVILLPPYLVLDFGSLIQDGYKLIEIGGANSLFQFLPTFKEYGVLHQLNTSFEEDVSQANGSDYHLRLAQENAIVVFDNMKSIIHHVETVYPETKCHIVPEATFPSREIYTYAMLTKVPVEQISKRLLESGIYNVAEEYWLFRTGLPDAAYMEMKIFEENLQPYSFTTSNPIIQSIIKAWLIFIVIPITAFIFELVRSIISQCIPLKQSKQLVTRFA